MRALACVVVLFSAAVGCGKSVEGPETYPVTGVVTLNGAPVADALVQFTPITPDGVIAGAQTSTGADGVFNVKLELEMGKSSKEGLPPGEYRVVVTKLELPGGQPSLSNPPKNTLPPKYATSETTPLQAIVKPQVNHFEFEL